jgi:hypothetical protein
MPSIQSFNKGFNAHIDGKEGETLIGYYENYNKAWIALSKKQKLELTPALHLSRFFRDLGKQIDYDWVSHIDLGYRDVKIILPRKAEAICRKVLFLQITNLWNGFCQVWAELGHIIRWGI